MDAPIRVFIIEDDTLLAQSVCAQLALISRGTVICEGYTTTGEAGLDAVLQKQPDVVLLDLDLGAGKINGFMVARSIREKLPNCKLIAVTKTRSFQPVTKALKIGFNGYLPKDESLETVITVIREAVAGKVSLPHSVARYLSEDNRYDNV